jgi:hypothetical protein
MHRVFSSDTTGRVVLALIGLGLLAIGVRTLLRGDLFFKVRGGALFPPVAVALGLFLLGLVVFRWRKLAERPTAPKGRTARKAGRRPGG